MPSPSAATLYRLMHLVKEQGYDIGIGTDGDADRLGIIDEKGNFIHPNEVLLLLYYYLLEYKGWTGSVVRNIATTHLLDKIAEDHGEKCFEVPVGFKHISSQMEADDSLIGGESSGGLTIRGHIKGKDGVFASSLLVEMISVTGKKLSELLDEIYGKYGYATWQKAIANSNQRKKRYCSTKFMLKSCCLSLNLRSKKSAMKMVRKCISRMVVGSSPAFLVLSRYYVFLQKCKIRTLRNVFFNSLKTSYLYN